MLGAWIIDAALKGAIVFVLAAILVALMRRRPAAERHAVWAVALALQLAIPALAVAVPEWNVPLLPAPRPNVTVSSIDQPSPATNPDATKQATPAPTISAPAPSSPAAPATRDDAPAAPRWYASPLLVLLAVWMAGCLAILLRLVAGTVGVSRMALAGERVLDGRWLSLAHRLADTLRIRRPLTLLRGARLGVPVTWGIVYPVVLLPDDADEWPEERRRYVLVHEMAHVKRLDALTQLVGQLALAFFWFNPLVWLATRRLVQEREHACDDYVLLHGTKASEYASDLLELVRSIGSAGHRAAEPAFAALAMARRSEFEGRMLSILDPSLDRKPISRTGAVMAIAAAFIVAVPLAAFTPFAKPDITATAAAVVPPAAETPAQHARQPQWAGACDTSQLRESSTTNHVNIGSDGTAPRFVEYVLMTPGRCIEARLLGTIGVSDDETRITSLPFGATAYFRERTVAGDRQLSVASGSSGELLRSYRVNGSPASFDDDGGARWLAEILPTVLREGAVNVPERVARLRGDGGVSRVLSMVASIRSSNSKRAHYEALLEMRGLSDDEMERLLRQLRRDLSGNSGDLRAVLAKVPVRQTRQATGAEALASVLAGIDSDGDKAAAATLLAMQPDASDEVLLATMRVARGINSDGDKARFLLTSAARYLTPKNEALRTAYFDVAESLTSDGDKARVLINAAPYGHADEEVTRAEIRAARGISSDGDKSRVLIVLLTQRLVTPEMKEAFLRAVNSIASEGDRARVLTLAIQQL